VTVPDVEVEHASASLDEGCELLAEPGEVGRVQRRLHLDRTCPLAPAHTPRTLIDGQQAL